MVLQLTPKHIEALAFTYRAYASNPRGEHRYMDYVNSNMFSELIDLEEMELVERVMRDDQREPGGLASWYHLTPRGRDYLDRLTQHLSDMVPETSVER